MTDIIVDHYFWNKKKRAIRVVAARANQPVDDTDPDIIKVTAPPIEGNDWEWSIELNEWVQPANLEQ
jgi:hypothetical protein